MATGDKTAVQSRALEAALGTWKGVTASPNQARFAGAGPRAVQEFLPEAKGDREELCGERNNCTGLSRAEQAGSLSWFQWVELPLHSMEVSGVAALPPQSGG